MSDKRHRNIYVSDASWADWKRYADSLNVSTSVLLEDAVSVYIEQRTSQSVQAAELVPELVTAKKQVDDLSKLLRYMIEGTETMVSVRAEKDSIREKEEEEKRERETKRQEYLQTWADYIRENQNLTKPDVVEEDMKHFDFYGFDDPNHLKRAVSKLEDEMEEVWNI